MAGDEFGTINLDFGQRVVIQTSELDWKASPMQGVLRKPLAREDAERGHATSIVRYEPMRLRMNAWTSLSPNPTSNALG